MMRKVLMSTSAVLMLAACGTSRPMKDAVTVSETPPDTLVDAMGGYTVRTVHNPYLTFMTISPAEFTIAFAADPNLKAEAAEKIAVAAQRDFALKESAKNAAATASQAYATWKTADETARQKATQAKAVANDKAASAEAKAKAQTDADMAASEAEGLKKKADEAEKLSDAADSLVNTNAATASNAATKCKSYGQTSGGPPTTGEFYLRLGATYLGVPGSQGAGAMKDTKAIYAASADAQSKPSTAADTYSTLPDSYEAADRGWLARLVWGRNTQFTLLANLTVDGVNRQVPLYTYSHLSNKNDGENFSSDLSMLGRDIYMRVSPSSSFSVKFDGKHTEATQTGALSAAVRVAKVAVGLLSPSATVVTKLNLDQVQGQSQIWDAALGKALGESVEETITLATNAQDLLPGGCGLLTLAAPGPSSGLDPSRIIGTWRVGVIDRRRSILSDDDRLNGEEWEISASGQPQKTTASRILGTQVGTNPNQTVESVLKSGKANDALTAWAAARNDADRPGLATAFCRSAVGDLHSLGLTTADARLGLWAALTGMSIPGNPPVGTKNDADSKFSVFGLKKACGPDILPFRF